MNVVAHPLLAKSNDSFDDSKDTYVVSAYRVSGNCGAWNTGDTVDALTTGADPNGHVIAGTMESRSTAGGFPGTDAACSGYLVPTVIGSLSAKKGPHGTGGLSLQEAIGGQLIPTTRGPLTNPADSTNQPIPFDTTQITSPDNGSQPAAGSPCHPLTRTGHAPCIAFQERGREGGRNCETQTDLAYSLTSPNGGSRRNENNIAYQCQGTNVGEMGTLRSGNVNTSGGVPFIATRRAVRRLTEVECERLMGLEDNWTNVTYRGKPAKGGPRYQSIGNGMATPVVIWIGERIQAACKMGAVIV